MPTPPKRVSAFVKTSFIPQTSIPHSHGVVLPKKDLLLQRGGSIPQEALHIEYSTWGDPSLPTIALFPSMSNNCFPNPSSLPPHKPAHGWWNKVMGVGPKFGLDLTKYHVVVGAVLGAPFGTTSPLSLNPATGLAFGSEFPKITPADMAKVQAMLLDELGFSKVHCVMGGSMGGMQAIEFACQFPARFDKLVSIASTAHTPPATVALRSMQRAAVRADPHFGSKYPVNGLKIARMIGTVAYRSRLEFDSRFSWTPDPVTGKFEVEEYLEHQARKFTSETVYDADCYLLLSEAMDFMNVGCGFPNFESGVKRIPGTKEVMLLSYSTDVLTPPQDLERFASCLGQVAGCDVYFEVLNSLLGHDTFLSPSCAEPLVFRLKTFLEGTDSGHRVRRLVQEMHG